MNDNRFFEKFQSKSDIELIKIIEAKIDRKIAKENDKSVLKIRDENRA